MQQLRLVQPRGVGRGQPGPPPAVGTRRSSPPSPRRCGWGRRRGSGRRPAGGGAAGGTPPTPGCSARRRWPRGTTASIRPVWTTRNVRMLTVPCRVYSNSCCSIEPGIARRIGCRSRTWQLGISSAQTTQIAPLGQPLGVGVAPEDLLGPLLELGHRAGRSASSGCGAVGGRPRRGSGGRSGH